MKPALSGERKKFNIRSAIKPQRGQPLSGVVVVLDEEGRGYTYIKFDASLSVAVGKALPQGTGPENPSYLKVFYLRSRAVWQIFVGYVGSDFVVLLWESAEKPFWLKSIRRDHA